MDRNTEEYKALAKAVTQRITLLRYFNEHIRFLKQGVTELKEGETSSVCPFHDETKPSFHYWHSSDTCFCFGCGFGGGLVQVYREVQYRYRQRKIDNYTALLELIKLYGLNADCEIQKLLAAAETADRKPCSVFDKYRQKAFDMSSVNMDDSVFTLAKFRQLNRRIMEDTTISETSRFGQYAQLDMLAAAALYKVKHK